MNRMRGTLPWVVVAALLLPSLALAEVSVQLDGRGNYKRYWYLTSGKGSNALVWRQIRPRLPQHVVLNPLGDNLGDYPPAIQVSPATGYPWVVWPKNIGNIKQLAFATWDGKRWTEPSLVAPGVPLVYDDRDPVLAIDQAGGLYLVWWRAEQTARVYFSSLILGRWTPPMAISEAGVEGRSPAIAVSGPTATISYETPTGSVTKSFETTSLLYSAASLMDNPIPPLVTPPPGAPGQDPVPGGGGVGGGGLRRN
jgi:hypothetical protein